VKDQAEVLWQTILGEVELDVSEAVYKTWFKPTYLLSIDGQSVKIAVHNFFTKNQFEKKFDPMLKTILRRNGFNKPSIEYVIESRKDSVRASDEEVVEHSLPDTAPRGNSKSLAPSGLNPRYRFNNFIVGTCNDLAHAAAQAAAAKPGSRYNPIFVYGGVGLGKTHLIQAIGNEMLNKNPAERVLYVTTETFVNDFLDHVRFKKKGFGERYRNIDALIVDDIQFIAGKEQTQDQFFHTFNALHQQNKQLVISSDRPPADIPTLTDRLRSRFQMGMVIDISLPDYETRCAIIDSKATLSGVSLPRDTTEYLADNIKTNIRELEGALNQLLAYCEMRGVRPDLSTASGLLGSITTSRPKHITARQIIDKTAGYFELKATDICSPARDKHIVTPRQLAMYLLRSELHMSFPKIAVELGRKDHTTALYSVNKIERAIKLDTEIREQVTEIRELLYV
jgi:chromosomal replication initiator protein